MPHDLTLGGDVFVGKDADLLYDDLARILMNAAISAVGARGVFHLALSGGSTPERFYIRLVTDPRFRAVPWDHAHLWVVDERCVSEDDPRSNFKLIRETLADHVPMRRRRRHPMPVLADDPPTAYEEELAQAFGLPPPPPLATTPPATTPHPAPGPTGLARVSAGGEPAIPRLDFVLLGMGEDGHTASLFPRSPALRAARWVALNAGPTVTPPPRLTMTFPLLNAARLLAVLITGPGKAAPLRRVADQFSRSGPDPETLPITGLAPADGSLMWFLDPAAAGTERM